MKRGPSARFHSISRSALYWIGATLSVLCAATVFINFPGHLSRDSITQLSEGVSGNYNSFNPPFMGFLMGRLSEISQGATLFFLVDIAIFYSACFLLLVGNRENWHWSLLLIVLVCLGPMVLIYNGTIWKDVFLANITLLGFAAMATDAPLSRARVTVAILAVSVAVLVRQQGLLIALMAAWCLSYAGEEASLMKRFWKTVEYFLMVLIVCQLTLLIVELSASSMHGASYGTGLNILFAYDIAGISYRTGPSLLTVFSEFGVDVEEFTDEVLRHYSAARIDSLELKVPFDNSLLPKQWVVALSEGPLAYFDHRSEVFLWLLGWHGAAQCIPFHIGVEGGGPNLLQQLGISPSAPEKLEFLWTYGSSVSQTLLFRPFTYFAIAMAMIPWLWRRRASGHNRALAMLLITAILYECSFFFIAIACDFRYSYFLIVSTMATLAICGPALLCSLLEAMKRITRNNIDK